MIAHKVKAAPRPILHNPMEGRKDAWQLGESIDDFLNRLPPSTASHVGPWIWVTNPYVEHHPLEQDYAGLTRAGGTLLDNYLTLRAKTEKENQGRASSTIGRRLGPHRRGLERDLRETALKHKVMLGKWMLFPSAENVDRAWRVVAEATVQNKLGVQAKVATGSGNAEGSRLICIHTKDFDNRSDVERVLLALFDMKLMSRESDKGIWYKADAYTHLGIESGNAFGLRASMYGSRDFLKSK